MSVCPLWKTRSTPISALVLSSVLALIGNTMPSTAFAQQACQLSNSDPDGDGYGWEDGSTCVVTGTEAAAPAAPAIDFCLYLSSDADGDGWGWENNSTCRAGTDTSADEPAIATPDFVQLIDNRGRTICQSPNADPDGDGYGWENNTSCIVEGSAIETAAAPPSNPICTSGVTDLDGDGWGWENNASCIVDNNGGSTIAEPDVVPDPDTVATDDSDTTNTADSSNTDDSTDTTDSTNTTDSSDATDNTDTVELPDTEAKQFSSEDITDLILITGQSNTLGSNSTWNPTLDAPHPRVFAYTSNGWQVAELYQSWDNGGHPGTGNPDDVDKIHNNFALHFGKRLAELDDSIVVGFVLVSEPGQGIRNWAPGAQGKRRVQQKVLEAINSLPSKSTLDGILWHQGETDWQLEGTSDLDAEQPAPIDYYPVRFAALIENLRLENWFDADSPFICGETIKAQGVNMHLNALNTDGDPATACVEAAGLPPIRENGNHFNASALRILGGRYAETYNLLR